MAFCPQCGNKLPDGARFCPSCGASVSAAAAAPAPERNAAPAATPVSVEARERRGGISALAILALIAVVVVAVVLWQQREGARPVAGNDAALAAEDPGGDEQSASAARESDTDLADVPVSAGGATEEATGSSDAEQARDVPDGAVDEGGVVPAPVIDGAFRDDRIEAAVRFPGTVTVRGEVVAPGRSGDPPSIGMGGAERSDVVVVNFAPDQRAVIEEFARGQIITVRCAGAGSFAGTTVLRDCRY